MPQSYVAAIYVHEALQVISSYVVIIVFYRSNQRESADVPQSLEKTLAACDSVFFPNINTILRVLLVTPVTTATVEHSNSSLRFVKSCYRSSSSEERLNALLLLFIHKDIGLDYNAIVDIFARRNHRRMALLNPLE